MKIVGLNFVRELSLTTWQNLARTMKTIQSQFENFEPTLVIIVSTLFETHFERNQFVVCFAKVTHTFRVEIRSGLVGARIVRSRESSQSCRRTRENQKKNHIWSYIVHIWPYMVHIWPYMVHIWQYMFIYGHI